MEKRFLKGIVLFLFFAGNRAYSQPCSGVPGANTVSPVTHTVCYGSAASMSLMNSYSSTGITYQWQSSTISPVGPFTSITTATQSSYTSQPQTSSVYWYNVVITCTNSNQSLNVLHTVSVVSCALPCSGAPASTSILPASQTVCTGDVASMSLTTTYTDTGIQFQWNQAPSATGPYTPIPTASLSTYTSGPLSTNAFYNVVVTCTNSGQSYTATQMITVTNCTYCAGIPASNTLVPLNQTVCVGSAASMSLMSSYTVSGISYQWQSSSISPAGPFSAMTNTTANYTTPPLLGTMYYNLVITCTNSGQSINVPHTVSVITCPGQCSGTPSGAILLPVTGTLCVNSAAVLSISTTYTDSGIIYQWSSSSNAGGPFIPLGGAVGSTYTASLLATTYFSVSITCTNSGMSAGTSNTLNIAQCVYINELNKLAGLRIFPNPAGGFLNVAGDFTSVTVQISDITGRLITEKKLVSPEVSVDVHGLSPGVYYVRIYQGPDSVIYKLVKE
jgi:hypothetical protein